MLQSSSATWMLELLGRQNPTDAAQWRALRRKPDASR
jgi:hypothetical protein